MTKELFAVSGITCRFDGCEQRLTDPSWTGVMAEIAHIWGYRKNSTRYDPTLSPAQMHGCYNLILLCSNHHAEVDDLNPDTDFVKDLKAMKHRLESRFEEWANDDTQTGFARIALLQLAEVDDAPPVNTMTEEEGTELFRDVKPELNSAESARVLNPKLQRSFSSPRQINEYMHADEPPAYLRKLEVNGFISRWDDKDQVNFDFTDRGLHFLDFLRSDVEGS